MPKKIRKRRQKVDPKLHGQVKKLLYDTKELVTNKLLFNDLDKVSSKQAYMEWLKFMETYIELCKARGFF